MHKLLEVVTYEIMKMRTCINFDAHTWTMNHAEDQGNMFACKLCESSFEDKNKLMYHSKEDHSDK